MFYLLIVFVSLNFCTIFSASSNAEKVFPYHQRKASQRPATPAPSVPIPLMPGTLRPDLDHGSSERLSHPETQVPLTEFISCLCWRGFIFVGLFPKESQNSTVEQEVRELAEQGLMRTVCASNCLPYRSGICLREEGQAWCCPSWPYCKQEAATPSLDFGVWDNWKLFGKEEACFLMMG